MKTIKFFVVLFFIFPFLKAQSQTLCDTYGGNTPDIIITGTTNASNLDFTALEGKHIKFENAVLINLDSDIKFKNCIIEIASGHFISDFEDGHTVEFDNCKVFECGGTYSFLMQAINEVNLKVTDSNFENFAELFHIQKPLEINLTNNEFTSDPSFAVSGIGHVIHLFEMDHLPGATEGQSFVFKNNVLNASSGIWLNDVKNVTIEDNIKRATLNE